VAVAKFLPSLGVSSRAFILLFGVFPFLMMIGMREAYTAPVYDFPASGHVLMQADEVLYDTEAEIVVARGKVEIAKGDRILLCDELVYERKTGTVRASGNVALTNAKGDTSFASSVTLDEDLSEGIAEDLGILLADDSRLAAHFATRHAGHVNELRRVVFTPCKVCKEKDGPPVLWQIRADRVTHDEERKTITYRNAYLDFYGIPVFYTPYFVHPDPSIERKTGLLAPTFGRSTDLGFMAELPVFWNISPSLDATLRPVFLTQENPVLKADIRHRIPAGHYELEMSGTYVDKRNNLGQVVPGEEFRGHLFGRGRFAFAKTWYTGFDVELTTDDTYLRRYDIFNETRLQTNLYAERFWNRNSLVIDSFWFQGLRVNDIQQQIPFIVPLIRHIQYFDAPGIGGQIKLQSNALVLERQKGTDSRRLSTQIEWSRRWIASLGQLFEPNLSLRGDVYHTDNAPGPLLPGVTRASEVIARGQPKASLTWRWPLMRTGVRMSQLVEPVAQVIYRPEGGNHAVIPNEDSLAFEFGEDNLFDENKLPGIDRWEDGSRANVGLHLALYGARSGVVDMLIGQSFSFNEMAGFGARSGLDRRESDYVGRLRVSPHPNLSIIHRFRLDQNTLKIEKNQLDVRSVFGPLSLEGSYARLEQTLSSAVPTTREEFTGEIGVDFLTYWRLSAQTRRDINLNRTVQNAASLGYTDECFIFELRWIQDYTTDRDVPPTNGFFVRMVFDHLG
jgi:LPS-assembly protein